MTYEPSPLEVCLAHPNYFGLETISNAQRAACRICDGYDLDLLWRDPAVMAMCGGVRPPHGPPKQVMLIAPIRTGKSLLASACAVSCALTCDCSRIRSGELGPRVPVLSTSLDEAKIVMGHLKGHIEQSKALSGRVVKILADSIEIRRDDGIIVEIKVKAGARAGASLVGRWLAGVVLDEVTLMLGQDDAVINLKDSLTAIEGRMLPGARTIMIGSPVAPPYGTAYEMLQLGFGKPNQKLVCLWPLGREFLPSRFTTEYLESLDEDVRRTAEERVFLSAESGFLDNDEIAACVEPGREYRVYPGTQVVAAMDPATRKNSWSLVVLEGLRDGRIRVCRYREWVPKQHARLSTTETMLEIAGVLRGVGTNHVYTDQYSADALSDIGALHGVNVESVHLSGKSLADAMLELSRVITEKQLVIPEDEPQIVADLKAIRKIPNKSHDRFSFYLPVTPDGRHCDSVPALIRALRSPPGLPAEDNTETYEQRLERLAIERASSSGDAEGLLSGLARGIV